MQVNNHHQNTIIFVNEEIVIGVVAPLKYVGRYACLELNFPYLTSKTLNFVLDTGASITSISNKVAVQLQLPIIKKKEDLELLRTAGAGGSLILSLQTNEVWFEQMPKNRSKRQK